MVTKNKVIQGGRYLDFDQVSVSQDAETHPAWQIANGKCQNAVVSPSAICHFTFRPAPFSAGC
jgi:hypothetical protein